MEKTKIAVIIGGMSTEHDVSIVSGSSVIQNLKKDRYEILPIYIDKAGKWYHYQKPVDEITVGEVGETITDIKPLENVLETLRNVDVIFPVLHGLYGEDGSIQGLFELLNKPYVGCNILASSICMDKVYAKIIFDKAGIMQAKYLDVRKRNGAYFLRDESLAERQVDFSEIEKTVEKKLGYPVFIKPSNSGSSVGIHKVHTKEELKKAVDDAANYDTKILVEENITGRELECAVLGNGEVKASGVGEILPAEEFYTFDAKYKNAASRVQIPADLTQEQKETIRNNAIKAFQAVDGCGLSRVDFFLEEKTGRILINEINTIPGFTKISMYPKLWEAEGLSYSDLLDELVMLAIQRKN